MDYIDYRRLQLFRHTMLLPIYTAENYVSLIEHHSFIEEKKVKPRYWLGNPPADVQTALQILMMGTGEEQLLTLAPNHRPFRSHSHALEKKYGLELTLLFIPLRICLLKSCFSKNIGEFRTMMWIRPKDV